MKRKSLKRPTHFMPKKRLSVIKTIEGQKCFSEGGGGGGVDKSYKTACRSKDNWHATW